METYSWFLASVVDFAQPYKTTSKHNEHDEQKNIKKLYTIQEKNWKQQTMKRFKLNKLTLILTFGSICKYKNETKPFRNLKSKEQSTDQHDFTSFNLLPVELV